MSGGSDLRASGLPGVGEVGWGAHLCHFYRSRADLLETVVPFFQAGIEAHERCLWITGDAFPVADASEALRSAVSDFDALARTGQIEVRDAREWHPPRADDAVLAWTTREAAARRDGFSGLRVCGEWAELAADEAAVHEAFDGRHILALCSFAVARCGTAELFDVLRHHGFALVRRDGAWETVRSATLLLADVEAEPRDELSAPLLGAPATGHGVRFYSDGDYPAHAIAGFLHASLLAGGGAIAFATPTHLDAIAGGLAELGSVDFAEALASERLHLGDARAAAAALVVDRRPQREAFERLVVAPLGRLLERFGRAHVYGELVDLLCASDDPESALTLEWWWNQLLHGKPAELLCGYSLPPFASDESVEWFRRVCDAHSEVAPIAEPRSDGRRLAAELEQSLAALGVEAAQRRRLEAQCQQLIEAERAARSCARLATDHLSHLQQVTSALAVAHGPKEIAEVVSSQLARIFGAARAWIEIATEEDGPLEPIGAPWHPPSTGEILRLPLAMTERRAGTLALELESGRELSPRERPLLDDYGWQVSLALDRALAFEEAQRGRLRLQLIADVARAIGQARLDLDDVVRTIAREVVRSGFAECCAIHLCRDQELTLAALHHRDETVRAELDRALRAQPQQLGTGLLGVVAESGAAVRLDREQLLDEIRAPLRPLLDDPIDGLVAVPLRTAGRVLGTLIASRLPNRARFTVEDMRLLQDLANRAALDVENAALFENAQRERERAEHANRAKDQFLAMLGHELRNPLSPILTAVELMRLRGGAETLAHERAIIERQVTHMVRLVDDLLDVSRITRGKIHLKREVVELAAVVAQAIEIASPELEHRAHRLVTSVPASGMAVDGDVNRLAQVIANLLTNAAKYTPASGLIEVFASARGARLALTVRDNGVGIDRELLPHVFDLFVQGAQSSDRALGGLGLGLAIARNLTEMHGGSLRVFSAGKGRGSEFTVELPRVESRALEAQHAPAPAPAAGSCGRRILVVDDNSDAAEVLAEALMTAGHVVRVAHDGPSALQAARELSPEVALLDIGLPVMDGYELGQRLRAADDRLRLVALTGYGQDGDRARSREAGFDEHLIKPVDFERVLMVIRRLGEGSA